MSSNRRLRVTFVKSRGPRGARALWKTREGERGARHDRWMPRPTPLPFPLSLGPFRYAEARGAGVARSRLRAPDVSHPHHGVYVPAPPEADVISVCEQLLPLLGEHAWFSHLTAARLWGMPLPFPWTPDEPIHVTTLGSHAPVRRKGVIGWETAETDIPRTMLGLIPVIEPAEVWAQLAVPGATGIDSQTGARRRLSRDRLVAVGDYLLTGPKLDGERRPLCSRDDLERVVSARHGKRGVVDLASALELVRWPVHSAKETDVRLGLRECGLPEPEVQVPVMTAAGLRHADLGYRAARLLIEYQGDHHRTDREQWLEDLTRLQLFEDAGYRVIAIGAHDLEPNCHALAARIRRALDGRFFTPDTS